VSTDQPITCLIADDHEIVRECLLMALSREPNIRVVGEGKRWRSRRRACRAPPPGGRPDGRAHGQCRRRHPPPAASAIASPAPPWCCSRAHAERNLLQRGREAGARGYVLKEAGHDTIVRAIDRVARGEDFIDPALAPSLLELSRESLITGREREILQLLADGMSNADVAQKLFISQETVKSHVRHILAKLEADNRTQGPSRSRCANRSSSSDHPCAGPDRADVSVHEIILDVLLAIALGVLGALALRARGSRKRAERNVDAERALREQLSAQADALDRLLGRPRPGSPTSSTRAACWSASPRKRSSWSPPMRARARTHRQPLQCRGRDRGCGWRR